MNCNIINIYTDGSCDSNPGGNGGYAAIIFDGVNPIKISGYEPNTTNQRMEILAVIKALEYFREPKQIYIYSDSAYVCNCYKGKWYENWMSNGWINSKKEPVANKDLWERFVELVSFHDIEFCKVKGHSNNLLNNECDKMAKEIIQFNKTIKHLLTIN